MFHFDRGLKLTKADLAVDICRRQPRGFISHAHYDHMARHELALCTPETARLYQLRLGPRRVLEMPYHQSMDWGGLRLTTFPAGHCLGSAMLLAEDGSRRLLYTGDFKLCQPATCTKAELPAADILVIESTYGDPRYRLTPRAEAIGQLLAIIAQALAVGITPVIQAYTLGKGQEITKLVSTAGIGVLQHPDVYRISRIYEEFGVDLGKYALYSGRPLDGHVVVTPPISHRASPLLGLRWTCTIATTGWAMQEQSRRRLRVDHAIALSDHADYDELLSAVAQVGAAEIYCTHGPPEFVSRLRNAGFNAFVLGQAKGAGTG